MIIDLPATNTSSVSKKMVDLREKGGANALGRVLTLIVVAEDGAAEEAIDDANAASREHPCRVITVVRGGRRGASRLDAQIRVGGDAGASEVIVMRLYGPLADHADSVVVPLLLPDAPVVVWWPGPAPADPAADPIGAMGQRRITDAELAARPVASLDQRSAHHSPGDTDLAWSRITLWRGLLAAALDQAPYQPVQRAVVHAGSDSPSGDLMAAWLHLTLRCPVRRVKEKAGTGLTSVVLERAAGPVSLTRTDGKVASLTQPGQPERRIALTPRQNRDCLAEELRRLDPDDIYGEVVVKGLPRLRSDKNTTAAPARRTPAKAATTKAATTKAVAKKTATAATKTAVGKSAAKKSATKRTAARRTTA